MGTYYPPIFYDIIGDVAARSNWDSVGNTSPPELEYYEQPQGNYSVVFYISL